jgi:4-amino-4-deoxy-L-arabinose transferase and related glycosyltransferases of PMT family
MLGCLAYFFYYFRSNKTGIDIWKTFRTQVPAWKWETLAVTGIILLACALRFWKLGSLFEGMTYDEAYKGLDAIAIRKFGERPVFLDWNGGREALIAYLVAFTQNFFDYTSVSIRIINAVAGVVSILFIYLFARMIFNSPIALLSTFLLAVSKWQIIHSRYGVRAGLYLVFEVASLYFLARGLNQNQVRGDPARPTGSGAKGFASLIAAGVIAGLGVYTYIAYRIFPIVILAFLTEKTVREHLSAKWKPLLLSGVVCIAIVAPMATFYIENKDKMNNRMKRTQIWNQQGKEKESPIKLIADSTMKTLGLFTFKGDPIARHDVNEEPMLSPFATAFFLLGLFLALIHPSKTYARFLLLYFFFTLLPGILSVGAPNVPRNFGALPVAVLFTSFGIYSTLQILNHRVLKTLFLAVVLSGICLTGIIDSMVRYPAILDSLSPRLAELWGTDRDPQNVAKLMNQLGPGCEVYVSPQFYFHSTVEYLTYSKSKHKLITPLTHLEKDASREKVIVVILQPNEVNPWWLRDDDGKNFYKWWNQVYGMEVRAIRTIIRKSYDSPFTKTSDWRLVKMLNTKYPHAKLLRFEYFNAYVFKL